MKKPFLKYLFSFFPIVGALIVLGFLYHCQDKLPNPSDAYNNLGFARNLLNYGQFEDPNEENPVGLTREPLPILGMSLHIWMNPYIPINASQDDLSFGAYSLSMKRHNLFWVGGCMVFIYLICLELFPNQKVAKILAFVVQVSALLFFSKPMFINTMYTELQVSTMVLGSSWALLWFHRKQNSCSALVTGTLLAGLILTKATFLYIVPVALIMLIFFKILESTSNSGYLKNYFVIILSIVILVGPWMIQNKRKYGSFDIVQTGGTVLLIRAYQNLMSVEEYKGAWYVWAPTSTFRTILGKLFGYKPADFEAGGFLQRLDRDANKIYDEEMQKKGEPDSAISYMRKAMAKKQFYYLKTENPSTVSLMMKDEAITLIKNNLLLHLKTTPLFFWRGIWRVDAENLYFPFKSWIPLFSNIIFIFLFMFALILKNMKVLTFSILSVGGMAFYSLLSHFIPRYGDPFALITLICTVYVISFLVEYIISSRKSNKLNSRK